MEKTRSPKPAQPVQLKIPMRVSVFTPTFNSGNKILRPLVSLMHQSHQNFEWLVLDDSPDYSVFNQLRILADIEPRLRLICNGKHSGVIGAMKRQLCQLATGEILVELDHDDELTWDCLAKLVATFEDPKVNFVYSDWCTMRTDGSCVLYGKQSGWAWGQGREVQATLPDGREVNQQGINNYFGPECVKTIVGIPNHVRAWRRDFYAKIGGHNKMLMVADDYELFLKTLIADRDGIRRLPECLYVYHYDDANASLNPQRNQVIQNTAAAVWAQMKSRVEAVFKK